MTVSEKAKELIKKFEPYASGYLGSSMLTNTEYPEVILKNAKKLSLICVDEILKTLLHSDQVRYWKEVEQEIEKL